MPNLPHSQKNSLFLRFFNVSIRSLSFLCKHSKYILHFSVFRSFQHAFFIPYLEAVRPTPFNFTNLLFIVGHCCNGRRCVLSWSAAVWLQARSRSRPKRQGHDWHWDYDRWNCTCDSGSYFVGRRDYTHPSLTNNLRL